MNWSRAGQTDPVFSQAKAEQMTAEASNKAAHARDLKAAKEQKKAEKTRKSKQ